MRLLPMLLVAAWPAWLSIESPVNPFDRTARDAVMLVHAATREGAPRVTDLTGTAEGIVNGVRRSVAIRFDTTAFPGVFAVRRQWPAEGAWIVKIMLAQTTALVTFDHAGNVASARVPTVMQNGFPIPRAVASKEIDSTLADAVKR